MMDDKDFYFANGLPECCLAIASLVLLCHIITMLQITNEEMKQLEKLDAAKAAYLWLPSLTIPYHSIPACCFEGLK